MTVEAGKLAPADAFSAERLELYRHGTTMFVQPITDPQSKKRRKFWAILGLIIRNCNTPWRTVKDAANAIKRTFGRALGQQGGATMITLQEKAACAARALKERRFVYPRLVREERMAKEVAEREIAIMEAIVEDYRRQMERSEVRDPAQGGLPL